MYQACSSEVKMIENEIRANKNLNLSFNFESDYDKYMENIEYDRISLYHHSPSDDCVNKGCGKCFTVDGNWKLTFPHCMFPVKSTTQIRGLNFAHICPNEPFGMKAFCKEHLQLAEDREYPVKVADFAKYCSGKNEGVNNNPALEESAVTSQDVFDAPVPHAVFKEQGTQQLMEKFPVDTDLDALTSASGERCRKDLGEKGKLRHCSRGHVFVVRSCAHGSQFTSNFETCSYEIVQDSPFWHDITLICKLSCRSESPSQVFLILISWLYETLKDVPEEKWSEIVLAYDNMCHLDGLKVARSPLPLPVPYNKMWLSIKKVIDDLHIRNHKDENCIKKYSPKPLREIHPEYNFMTAEQTFVWLSRYKRILSSMKKTHHFYFLHRIVQKRNIYTDKCLKLQRKSLLPKAKE